MLSIKHCYLLLCMSLLFLGITTCFAEGGFEYLPDNNTLGLWHFDEAKVKDISNNNVEAKVEGKAAWDPNQDWNKEDKPGKSFRFDGNTVISLGKAKELLPETAVTVEAWVYPEDLNGWRLICANWDGPPGAYHLGVSNAMPKFHINTTNGGASAEPAEALKLKQWYHIAGTYDSNAVKLYINGKEAASKDHGGKLKGADYDVVIGSKNTRQFKWIGLIDEVRISDIAREADELSPNFEKPQAVELTELTLPLLWGSLKR
ncbi:MAG: LamG domain-containing protein [Candidatus Poribacteria bacterium]|nr:LamG domain-containing protein [Candidatus Poribacteria bacterium]